MFGFKQKSYPEFWQQYIAHFQQKEEQLIENIRFVVFDTETTGLDLKKDVMLSIGCVAVFNLKIRVADQLECYVVQENFNPETVKIHGLLREGHLKKIDEKEAIIRFLKYIENAVLVAHHAAFDVTMINRGLKRLELPKLKNKVIDTRHLFQKTKLDTSKAHFCLDELANRFHIPLHDRHTASGDAYITALLFLRLVSNLQYKNPSLDLKSLLKPHRRIGLL